MIKLENVVPASLEQMEFIIQGMRNPMNSWEKSDSGRGCDGKLCGNHCAFSSQWCGKSTPSLHRAGLPNFPGGIFPETIYIFMLPLEGFMEPQNHLSRVYFSFQDLYLF